MDDVSTAPVNGTKVRAGEAIGFVDTYYGHEPILPAIDGLIIAVKAPQGKEVQKGEIVAFVQ